MNFLVGGKAPGRLGNAHPNIVPYEAFATADDHVILAVGNDAQFSRFCNLAGAPELAENPAFATNALRVGNREDLIPLVRDLMLQHDSQWWLNNLSVNGVPSGPINTLDQVFADEQVQHRNMQIELDHPQAGKVPAVANPVKFSETPIQYTSAPPTLGQHTDKVLADLGLNEDEIAQLKEQQVVS
jgi:crotonobetainyl-CoA:carnitine CoA-transferase CaiB-like acyl-CoA transferase